MNTSKCECGIKRIFACVMSVVLACIIGASFAKTNVAFATTETLDLQGTMTFSLEYQEDPAPIVPDDVAGSDDSTQDALRASEISRSAMLARTSDVLLYAVLALLIGSLVFAYVSVKSTRKVPAHAKGNVSVNACSSKHKLIIVAMLGISLVLGTTSVGIRAFAEDEDMPSPVTLSSNVVVNQHGKILSNTLSFTNKLTGDVTIDELNAPDELSGWVVDIDKDQVILAGETVEKSWTPDSDAILGSLLDRVNAGEEVKLTFSVKASYNKFTITWDGNFAGSMNATTQYVENDVAGFPQTPERENYDFVAWNTEMDGSGDEVNTDYLAANPIAGDTTFYAVWAPKTYNITYELNGGKLTEGEENPATYVYLTGVDSFKSPNKVGHTFNGWSTDAAGANKIVSIDNSQAGDITLYANWAANTYNITYNLDSGTLPSGQTNPATYTYGVGVTSFAPLEKTGHDFVGWFDAATDGNQVTFITTTDIEAKTLYARFTPKVFNITYELDGGEGNMNPATYTYGIGVQGFTTVTKVGYTFAGWYSESSGGSAITNISTTSLEDKTLYARWTPNTNTPYKVEHYKQNVADDNYPDTPADTDNLTGTTVADTNAQAKTKTGDYANFTLSGTVTQEKIAADGTTIIKLYYTRDKFNVTFDLNSKTGTTPDVQSVKFEGHAEMPANPTTTGYVFDGWYSSQDASGNEFDFATTQVTAAITLYAKWSPIQYTVSFNKNDADATGTMESITCTYDQPLTLPDCTFTKQGAVISGWATSSAGDVVYTNKAKIEENLTSTASANIELFAKWQNGYTVTYDPTGGAGASVTGYWDIDGTHSTDVITETVLPGETIKGPKDVSGNAIYPTPNDENNEGYMFDGWYEENGDLVNVGDSISENKKVFAKYMNGLTFMAPAVSATDYPNPRDIPAEKGQKYSLDYVNKAAKDIAAKDADGDATQSEYYEKFNDFMTNDSYHLYTLLNGKDASEADSWVEFRIVHVGQHDKDTSGLTFQAVHMLPTAYQMNSTMTNSGGWASSALYSKMKNGGEIYNIFNNSFSSKIVNVTKPSTKGSFWLASYSELTGYKRDYAPTDGKQFTYWVGKVTRPTNSNSDLRNIGSRSGINSPSRYWWERTPATDGSWYFLFVDSDGVPHISDKANNMLGVVPCFAL